MTTPHRTLQMALDALDAITDDVDGTGLNTMPSFDKAIDAITALREALSAPEPEPVALESVHLTRDTRGMCVVRVNGRLAIRDNGDIIDHMATLEWFAAPPAAPEPEPVAINYVPLHNFATRLRIPYNELCAAVHASLSFPSKSMLAVPPAAPAPAARAALEDSMSYDQLTANLVSECKAKDAEIAALRAEIAALQEDAKRWRALDAMLRHPGNPMTPTYRLVRTCSTFGDDRDVQDWRKEVDAARKGEA